MYLSVCLEMFGVYCQRLAKLFSRSELAWLGGTTAVYGFQVEKKRRGTCHIVSACSAQPWAVIMVRAVSKTSRGREDLGTRGSQVVPNISLHYNHSLGPTFRWTVEKATDSIDPLVYPGIGLKITFGELCHLLSHWCDAHKIVESILPLFRCWWFQRQSSFVHQQTGRARHTTGPHAAISREASASNHQLQRTLEQFSVPKQALRKLSKQSFPDDMTQLPS